MKKKRWASYSKRLVESGVVDPSELSEMVGVSVETARRLIDKYTGSRQGSKDTYSDYTHAEEEIVDISPRPSTVAGFDLNKDKRLRSLRLGPYESGAIPSTWGSNLPIHLRLDDNLLALESINATATVDYESYLAMWLNRERSKLNYDRYLSFFGLKCEDLPIPPADLKDAMDYLANNEEYTTYLAEYVDPQGVMRRQYKLPDDSFYLKGTLAKPSVVQYSYEVGSSKKSYILDFALQTNIFLEDPSSDQPWMLFSRKDDHTTQNGIQKRVFTFVGAQGILENFCTQQLIWICRSFPEMMDSDIRVFGDPEITPIESVLDATLP